MLSESRPAEEEIAAAPVLDETAALIPIFGKALLAIAAAYLPRALAEARVLPLPVCIGAGILYSFFWLLILNPAVAPPQNRVGLVGGRLPDLG